MQATATIPTRSGYAVLGDRTAVIADAADLEGLERAAAAGRLVHWPSLADEMTIRVMVDESLPAPLRRVAQAHATTAVDAPSGVLRLTDAATLDAPGPADVTVRVAPGRYQATVLTLDWSSERVDAALRRRAGTTHVVLRDAVGLLAFAVSVATFIGLPVFVIGRALDDGLGGVIEALMLGAFVLGPLWLVVVLCVRAPWLRRVDRIDAALADHHPDAVVLLERVG